MTDIMLDLETWGKTPGSDIRSIGACVFNPVEGWVGTSDKQPKPYNESETDRLARQLHDDSFTFYITTNNPIESRDCYFDGIDSWRKYNLTRDSETIEWWSEQSEEAQAAFHDPKDLQDALMRFGIWLDGLTRDPEIMEPVHVRKSIRIWAHGPQFDVSIIEACYRAVGLHVPWHYRAPRDTRTILEAAGIDPHHGLEMFATGTHHHALDDAICQAKAVCAAYRALKAPVEFPDPIA